MGAWFDAAYAGMSFTTMPDAEAVLREAADCLVEWGHLAVLDPRPFQTPPLTLLNSHIIAASKRLTDWHLEIDVPGAMRQVLWATEVKESYDGTLLISSAVKSGESADTSG